MKRHDAAAGLASVALVRRLLARRRTAQRLPAKPSAVDQAVAAAQTPAERARVRELLVDAGCPAEAVLRAELLAASSANDRSQADVVDAVTQARARKLLARSGRGR